MVKAASESEWVRTEWEAAFHRAVMDAQNFLIVGRIEEFPLPELLRPRLQVDLFPEIDSGIAELVRLWRNDQEAESESSMAAVQAKIVARGEKEALPIFRRLAAQRAALASLFNHPTKHLGQWHQAMERLEKECNDLESRLVRHAGALVEEKKPARVTWEDVRATGGALASIGNGLVWEQLATSVLSKPYRSSMAR